MKMKCSILVLLASASVALHAQSHSGAVFELKMQSTQGLNGTVKIYYDTLGTRSEVNASMNSGFTVNKTSLVKKSEPNMVYQLDDRSHTYSTADVSNAAEYGSDPASATLVSNDTINGYACMHVKVRQGDKNWEVWTTRAITEYAQFSAVMNRQRYIGNHGMHDALKAINAEGFPVKIILTDKDGTTTTTLEKMTRQSLSDALFEIPSGYKKGGSAPAWGGAMPH